MQKGQELHIDALACQLSRLVITTYYLLDHTDYLLDHTDYLLDHTDYLLDHTDYLLDHTDSKDERSRYRTVREIAMRTALKAYALGRSDSSAT